MKIEFFRISLRADSRLLVSAPETLDFPTSSEPPASALDLPLRRDLNGMPVVPATAVAGSLRAHLPEAIRPEFMGFVSRDESSRSALTVLGVEVMPPESGAPVAAFHRTAIDSWSGAAAVGKLFDGEALAADTRLVVRMALEGSSDEQVLALRQALATWVPRLGRGTSTGAGRISVDEITSAGLDLSVMPDLLLYLNSGGPAMVDEIIASRGRPLEPAADSSEFLLDEEMEVVDALHVGGVKPTAGNVQTFLRDARGEPVIPGTTLKGILRSRIEYILRSVGVEVCADGTVPTCPSCHLFGYTLPTPDAEGRTGRRGRIAVHDAQVSNAVVAVRDHVAIDRVTGGARDQALFATEVVTQGRFSIRVETLEPVPHWAKGLLLVALADIDEGFVGIGGGTTRGQGTVKRVGSSVRETHGAELRESLAALVPEGEQSWATSK